MNQMHHLKVCLAASQISYTTLQGRNHMVVPVVMLTEGVHNGSCGPLYYPMDEITGSAPLWNGRPVVLGHPMSGNTPVSAAANPHIYERSFGKVFNTCTEGKKLKAELWLDTALTERVAPKVLEAIKAGRNIEVSTGLFTNDDTRPGVWNGEQYNAVTRNYRPDHLAILIDQTGACSWADGCGIRANTQKENAMYVEEPLLLPVINWHEDQKPTSTCPACGTLGEPAPASAEETPLELPTINWKP